MSLHERDRAKWILLAGTLLLLASLILPWWYFSVDSKEGTDRYSGSDLYALYGLWLGSSPLTRTTTFQTYGGGSHVQGVMWSAGVLCFLGLVMAALSWDRAKAHPLSSRFAPGHGVLLLSVASAIAVALAAVVLAFGITGAVVDDGTWIPGFLGQFGYWRPFFGSVVLPRVDPPGGWKALYWGPSWGWFAVLFAAVLLITGGLLHEKVVRVVIRGRPVSESRPGAPENRGPVTDSAVGDSE